MGLFGNARDPLKEELRRLDREARQLAEEARRLEKGIEEPEPESREPGSPIGKVSFPDAASPTWRPRESGTNTLRVQQRQIKFHVFVVVVVCLVLIVLVGRVVGWL
jgi:hypothetical protein